MLKVGNCTTTHFEQISRASYLCGRHYILEFKPKPLIAKTFNHSQIDKLKIILLNFKSHLPALSNV